MPSSVPETFVLLATVCPVPVELHPLAIKLLSGEFGDGDLITVDYIENRFIYE